MGKGPSRTTIGQRIWLRPQETVLSYRLLPFGLPKLLEAFMMRRSVRETVLDEEIAVWKSHCER